VAEILERVGTFRDYPEAISVDNGSEFYSKAMDLWAYRRGGQLWFIRPGKPVENAYIERFNGRLREECLYVNLLFSLEEARVVLEAGRHEYNIRPHTSIGNLAPWEGAKHARKRASEKPIFLLKPV
jgi:putative transposase